MKFRITKPRILPGGKRAEYWGVRIACESVFENQAMQQIYPGLGLAPKGEKTKPATELRFQRLREAVEHRAYLLSLGRPVLDETPIEKRVKEYLDFGRTEGGKRGFAWAPGHAEHVGKYLKDWISALSLRTLGDIKQGPFDAEKARLAKYLAPNTVNRRVDALRGICTWAVRRGYLPGAPFRSRSLDKTPRKERGSFALDELRLLFRDAPWKWSLVYRTAYFCRLRRNELASLKVRSVLWSEGLIDLAAKDAKDKRRAFVPIPQGLLNDLWALAFGRPEDAPLLEFSKRKAALRLHQHMERLGIPLEREGKRRDFHSLGASTATSMDRHGVGPALASKAMRHKSYSQTEAYVKREAAEVRAVMQGLEDEIGHTDDTFLDEEKDMSLQTESGQSLARDIATGGRAVPHPPLRASRSRKIAPFPRKKREARPEPETTWPEFQKLAAHLRHMVSSGEAETLKAFFALTATERVLAVSLAQRKAGEA